MRGEEKGTRDSTCAMGGLQLVDVPAQTGLSGIRGGEPARIPDRPWGGVDGHRPSGLRDGPARRHLPPVRRARPFAADRLSDRPVDRILPRRRRKRPRPSATAPDCRPLRIPTVRSGSCFRKRGRFPIATFSRASSSTGGSTSTICEPDTISPPLAASPERTTSRVLRKRASASTNTSLQARNPCPQPIQRDGSL